MMGTVSQAVTDELLTRLVVSIEGMTCSACSSAVESALNGLPAVKSATVALLQNRGEVVYRHNVAQVCRYCVLQVKMWQALFGMLLNGCTIEV